MNLWYVKVEILSTLFIAGCSGIDLSKVSDEDLERLSEKAVVCNSPYIRVGVQCCLDKNENNVCDSDEGTIQESTEELKVTSPEEIKRIQDEIINNGGSLQDKISRIDCELVLADDTYMDKLEDVSKEEWIEYENCFVGLELDNPTSGEDAIKIRDGIKD